MQDFFAATQVGDPPLEPATWLRTWETLNEYDLLKAREAEAIYTTMTKIWRRIHQQALADFKNPKLAWKAFLLRRSVIRAVYPRKDRWLREHAWCWYHTTTPLIDEVHFEPKVLTNCRGERLLRNSVTTIILELLTVEVDRNLKGNIFDETGLIDQITSEVEWRRGLHSERSLLVLTK